MIPATLAASYGYGQSYREYPQVQLEQQPTRRLLPVFQPPPVPYPTVWMNQLANWAAIGRVDEDIYLVRIETPPIGPPAMVYPQVPWSVEQANWPAIGYLRPVVYLVRQASVPLTLPAAAMLGPFVAQVLNWAAIGRVDEDLYLVSLGTLPVNPPPPALPSTLPFLMQANWAAVQRTYTPVVFPFPLQPAGDDPVPFPPLGSWSPAVMKPADVSAIYSLLRVGPLVKVVPPPPLTIASWMAQVLNWAALGKTTPVVYLVRMGSVPIGQPPVPFPKLGDWPRAIRWLPSTEAIYSLLALPRLVTAIPPAPPAPAIFPPLPIWPWELYYRDLPLQIYLRRILQLPTVGPTPAAPGGYPCVMVPILSGASGIIIGFALVTPTGTAYVDICGNPLP